MRGLKEWVSTSTRTDGQTSDEVFGDGMARLGNGLQNWVIVNFRKAKMGEFLLFIFVSRLTAQIGKTNTDRQCCRPDQDRRGHAGRVERVGPHVRGTGAHVQSPPPPVHCLEHPRGNGIQRVLRRSIRRTDQPIPQNGGTFTIIQYVSRTSPFLHTPLFCLLFCLSVYQHRPCKYRQYHL